MGWGCTGAAGTGTVCDFQTRSGHRTMRCTSTGVRHDRWLCTADASSDRMVTILRVYYETGNGFKSVHHTINLCNLGERHQSPKMVGK